MVDNGFLAFKTALSRMCFSECLDMLQCVLVSSIFRRCPVCQLQVLKTLHPQRQKLRLGFSPSQDACGVANYSQLPPAKRRNTRHRLAVFGGMFGYEVIEHGLCL